MVLSLQLMSTEGPSGEAWMNMTFDAESGWSSASATPARAETAIMVVSIVFTIRIPPCPPSCRAGQRHADSQLLYKWNRHKGLCPAKVLCPGGLVRGLGMKLLGVGDVM